MSAFGIAVDEACVCILKGSTTRAAALDRLVDRVAQAAALQDADAFRRAVHAGEADSSTGIGGGVAIPHVLLDGVAQPVLGVGIVPDGVDFAAVDGKPVQMIVMFLLPAGANKIYLGLLAQLMVALRVPGFLNRLTVCQSPAEVIAIINESGG